MKQYEITYLTREEPKAGAPVAKVIESLDGKITSSSHLGQKQLAYPIKKEKSAFYTTVLFEIPGEKVLELNRKLNLEEEILRHLIISAKVGVISPLAPPLKPEKAIEKPLVEKPAVPLPEIKEEKPKPLKPKPVRKKPVLEEGVSEEDRLKALDKKLDELLKE